MTAAELPAAELPIVAVLAVAQAAANVRDIVRAAQGLCRPVFLFTEASAATNPDLVRLAGTVARAQVVPASSPPAPASSWTVRADAVSAIVTDLGAAGLTTFHDSALDLVDEALDQLALPGRSTRAHPWDKLHQRRILADHGLTRVRSVPLDAPADLPAAVDLLGLPIVIKPRRSAAGAGLAFLRTADDVDHQLAHRREFAGLLAETVIARGHHPRGGALLTDCVSVETLNHEDDRVHAMVTDKLPISIVPRAGADGADLVHISGDLVPSRLPDADRQAVVQYVSRCLTALGVRWRVTHTEVALTPDGPEIIEVNGRTGGFLVRLLRLVHGVDLVGAALCLALGQRPPEPPTPTGFALGYYPPFADPTGPVRSAVSVADLRAVAGVRGVDAVANQGDPKELSDYRACNVTLYDPSADGLIDRLTTSVSAVRHLFHPDGLAVP